MTDCLVCCLDRRDCECFDDVPEMAAQLEERPRRDHEFLTLAVLDATGVLDGVPGIPSFL